MTYIVVCDTCGQEMTKGFAKLYKKPELYPNAIPENSDLCEECFDVILLFLHKRKFGQWQRRF